MPSSPASGRRAGLQPGPPRLLGHSRLSQTTDTYVGHKTISRKAAVDTGQVADRVTSRAATSPSTDV
jgi:hypothetical protein